jgi:hypothetical protein
MVRLERLVKFKEFNDHVGIRTRELPACVSIIVSYFGCVHVPDLVAATEAVYTRIYEFLVLISAGKPSILITVSRGVP